MFWLGSQMVIRYSPSIAFYKIIYFRESGHSNAHFVLICGHATRRKLPECRRFRVNKCW